MTRKFTCNSNLGLKEKWKKKNIERKDFMIFLSFENDLLFQKNQFLGLREKFNYFVCKVIMCNIWLNIHQSRQSSSFSSMMPQQWMEHQRRRHKKTKGTISYINPPLAIKISLDDEPISRERKKNTKQTSVFSPLSCGHNK